MRELFIYYRSATDQAAAVQLRVRAFQAALCLAHPGLVARLLRRPEVKDGMVTWMETYTIAPMRPDHELDEELQRQIETKAACLRDLINGERHTEVFVTCAC